MKYIKILSLCFILFLFFTFQAFGANNSPRIVIFAFENLSKNTNDNWISGSVPDNLTMAYNKLDSVEAIERYQIKLVVKDQILSSTGFMEDKKAIETARILCSDIAVTGTYKTEKDQIKFTASIIDSSSGKDDIKNTIEISGELKDLFTLENTLALKILENLNITLSKEQSTVIENSIKSANSLAVYENFMKAKETIDSASGSSVFEPAIESLKKTIEEDPDFIWSYIELAKAYGILAQWNSSDKEKSDEYKKLSLDYALQALKLNPEIPNTHRITAESCLNSNKEKEALEAIKTAIKLEPDNIENLILYSQITKQDMETGIKILEKDIKTDINNPILDMFIATQYINKFRGPANLDKAAVYLKKVVDKYPNNHYAYINLSTIYQILDKDDLAEQYINKALQTFPQSFLAHYQAGIVCLKKQDFKKGESYLKSSIELNPEWVSSYNLLGNMYKIEKKYDKALDIYNKAIKIKPEYDSPYVGIASIYILQKHYDLAESTLTTGINKAPMGIKMYNLLADIYKERKQYKEAVATLEKIFEIIDIGKTSKGDKNLTVKIETYMKIGGIYNLQNQFNKAIDNYNQAKALNPANSEIYNLLADIYITKKQWKEVLSNYQKIVELEPKNPNAYYNLGNALMVLKQYGKAKAAFVNSLKYKPDLASAHYNIGVIYWIGGNYKASAREWQITIKLDPNHQAAKTWLNKAVEKLKESSQQ